MRLATDRAAPLAAWVALALSVLPLTAHAEDRQRWQQPWVQPHDAQAAATRGDEYAWRVFVAINWPADPSTRSADAKAALGADRPSVWETWQNALDIFRDDGADPGPWSGALPAMGSDAGRRFETVSLKDLPNLRHIVGGRMVALKDPLASARRLTETRVNRAAFEYIRAQELYNLEGQLRILQAHRAVAFPSGAVQVKAKWRPIRTEERPRYHCVPVRMADGSTRLYGLTALHIVTKDLPNWFWATFEQVDNPALADGEGWQLPSSDRFACGSAEPNCNRAPGGIGLEGTVWQYYRLRGTLTDYVDAGGQPLRLANSELEAGMQQSASCITCHARASIGRLGQATVRLPVFEDPLIRRGFIGLPQADWFRGSAQGDELKPTFQPLDFVWSLAKAQPKRGS